MNKGVLVADTMEPICYEILRQSGVDVENREGITYQDLLEEISDYDALVVRSRTKVDESLLDRAHDLKFIARSGSGVDNITAMQTATERGIVVANAPDALVNAVAEDTIGKMLGLYRRMSYLDNTTRAGEWVKGPKVLGRELKGKTLGIWGFGKIGKAVAEKAYLGHQMRIIYFDQFVDVPYLTGWNGSEIPVEKISSYETLLREADFVSVHVPGEGNDNLINADNLRLLRKGSPVGLINDARGNVVNIEDVDAEMGENEFLYVALDTFPSGMEQPGQKPLTQYPERSLLTPHTAGNTYEAQQRAARDTGRNILNYLNYGICHYIVNGDGMVLTPETFPERFFPYFALTERLAKLARGFVGEIPADVQFTCYGDLDQFSKIYSRAVVMGTFNSGLTVVNAPAVGSAKGVNPRRRDPHTQEYGDAITIDFITPSDNISLRGVMNGGQYFLMRAGPHREVEMAEERSYDYDLGIQLPKNKGGYTLAVCEYDDERGALEALGKMARERGLYVESARQQSSHDKRRAVAIIHLEGYHPENVYDGLTRTGLQLWNGTALNTYRAFTVTF